MVEDSEIRKRLVQQMQKDKEEKLNLQRKYYEEKIKLLREQRREKKEKLLSPRELQKEIEKGKQEVEEYKTAKFQQLAPVRYAKIISKGVFRYPTPHNRRPKRVLPTSSFRRRGASSSRFANRPSPSFQSPEARRQAYLRLLMRQAMNRGWNSHDLDSVAWSDFFQTRMMEFEMNQPRLRNIAANTAWLPASEVKTMESEIGNYNKSIPRTNIDVGNEAKFFAKLTDISPAINVNNQALAFANVLTPRMQRRPTPRRRRRR